MVATARIAAAWPPAACNVMRPVGAVRELDVYIVQCRIKAGATDAAALGPFKK